MLITRSDAVNERRGKESFGPRGRRLTAYEALLGISTATQEEEDPAKDWTSKSKAKDVSELLV
jgi:hypothetical protein